MTPKELEILLSQDESEYLEFKERLDLSSKRGKAHFLKEILSLANSLHGPSYMIIGVEDKTKKPVGVVGVTEEQLQQIVSGYCKPPIKFSYTTVKYQGVSLGVIQIFRSNSKPHTLKTSLTYQDTSGRQVSVKETQIFVRHGSIISEATREEVLALAHDRDSNIELLSRAVNELEKMDFGIRDVNYLLGEISDHVYDGRPRDRVIEATSISIIVGCICAWIPGARLEPPPLLAIGLWFVTSVVFSALGIVDFSLLRALVNSFVSGIIFSELFPGIAGFISVQNPSIPEFVAGTFAGAIAGTIGAIILLHIERGLRS